MLLPTWCSLAAPYICTQNPYVGNDLTEIDAEVIGGTLVVKVLARQPFESLMQTTHSQVQFFIDADQNSDTGDARPGAIRGADYRISCFADISACTLYQLPTTVNGPEQQVNIQVSATPFAQGYGLQVSVPAPSLAPDVFAVAHGRSGFYGGGTGNGDRCPEVGAFDTAIGSMVVRSPAAVVDAELNDEEGSTLAGWRFQTFGDQFRISVSYQSFVNPLSFDFQGRVELDTDGSLLTGLVQTPFVGYSPFNEIPSWGWDAAIQFRGGEGTASDPTPFFLDFGKQSDFIIPLTSTAPLFPFGERYNDGRWRVKDNFLVLEGSVGMLDSRHWRLPGNGVVDVSRVITNGQVTGRLFTNVNEVITDVVPKNGQAFDTGEKSEVAPIQWVTGKMVSGTAPANDLEAQWDLTQVDGQIDSGNLIVRGTLTRLESSWRVTDLLVFIDTDLDSSTGEAVRSISQGATIGADYIVAISPRNNQIFLGYTALLLKPDNSKEGHDSWLNMKFSDPNLVNSPAQSIVTIPLDAIGNPQNGLRLYFATVASGDLQDIAPTQPLIMNDGLEHFPLSVNILDSDSGVVTSNPPGISCGTDCSENYANGTSVTLTAAPAEGYVFDNWSGDCSGTASTATVVMNANKSCTASFGRKLANDVPISNLGGDEGSMQYFSIVVPTDASNLNISTSGGSGDADLYVRRGAQPTRDDYDCRSWNNGNDETCSFATPSAGTYYIMLYGYEAYSGVILTASYTSTSSNFTLTVNTFGQGIVTSNPAGINCGADCSQNFSQGASVTLIASPLTGFDFIGWGGDCSGTGSCAVLMSANKNVSAMFSGFDPSIPLNFMQQRSLDGKQQQMFMKLLPSIVRDSNNNGVPDIQE